MANKAIKTTYGAGRSKAAPVIEALCADGALGVAEM